MKGFQKKKLTTMDKIEKIYFVDQTCHEKEFEIESSEFDYKSRKAAYLSARAPGQQKSTRLVFAEHWAGKSQRTLVRGGK